MEVEAMMEMKNGIKVPRLSPERWEELKRFPLRPDDVFIVTFPRSGTTWMQQIVKLLRTGSQPEGVKLDRSIPWLEFLDSDFGKMLGYTSAMMDSSDVLSPRAFKSHLTYDLVPGGLPHTTPAKYIYVMRNPKDVCVSYWYHWNAVEKVKNRSWNEHMDLIFASKDILFGDWFGHVLGWWKHNSAHNILFIKYEEMKRDPLATIRTVAQFIDVENITHALVQSVLQKSSFASMKKDSSCNSDWLIGPGKVFSKDSHFIRKGEIGGWRQHFSEDQNKRYDEMYAQRMAGSGLDFRFD